MAEDVYSRNGEVWGDPRLPNMDGIGPLHHYSRRVVVFRDNPCFQLFNIGITPSGGVGIEVVDRSYEPVEDAWSTEMYIEPKDVRQLIKYLTEAVEKAEANLAEEEETE